MKLSRTAKLKLNVKIDQILPSLQAYTKAFNLVCQVGYDKKIYNAIELHKLTYQNCRENFNLPSQLAISARTKAVEALKSIKSKNKYSKCPQSKLTSIRLDCNSYSILKSGEISILTIDGRKKLKLDIPAYYQHYFNEWKYTSADLVVKKQKVYLHISFEKDVEDIKSNGKFLGVDRGINQLAVTSDNKFYSGDKLKFICQKRKTLRSNLQKNGSKSAKRHLKKLSGKEKRFKADLNHKISKEIINSLNPGDTIALEKLTGIRNRKVRKRQRAALNSWNYYQLEQFLIYKAIARGINVVYVNPAYTSQKCSKCGNIDKKNRKNQANFCCKACGFKLNADLNASRNISVRALDSYKLSNGAVVNQPIVGAEMLLTSHQPCAGGN
jgi:IS605 OrfB family transposase